MQLSKLIVDSKDTWVEYPGCPGFEVKLQAISRKELMALRKRCVTTKFDRKTKQPVEELNEDLFLEEFSKATIKDWKGLKLKYLEHFVLSDIGSADPESPLEYSEDNALTLLKASSDFDTWVNDSVFDLENFRGGAKGGDVVSSGKVEK